MAGPTLRTLRFARAWLSGSEPAEVRETVVDDGRESLPATVVEPRKAPVSGSWIALHGVTRPGRRHPQLLRFARAFASGGVRVLLPEIREWTELRLAPERTVPVVRACVDHLDRAGSVTRPPGLVGFSFGAPQAVRAAADPTLRDRLGGVVGFGAYCDVERTFRFQLTGRHEWRGRKEHLEPDPYGRWIIAANYLARTSGHEDAGDVADALRRLAAEAGDRRVPAADPVLRPLRGELRAGLPGERRPLFDLFAPAAGERPDPEAAGELASRVARAALRASPALEVRDRLSDVGCPVELIHGRSDRLIPYTETLRLREAFPDGVPVNALVTSLFTHSRGSRIRLGLSSLREGWTLFRTLRRVVALA